MTHNKTSWLGLGLVAILSSAALAAEHGAAAFDEARGNRIRNGLAANRPLEVRPVAEGWTTRGNDTAGVLRVITSRNESSAIRPAHIEPDEKPDRIERARAARISGNMRSMRLSLARPTRNVAPRATAIQSQAARPGESPVARPPGDE